MKKNWIDVHDNLHFHQKTLRTKDKLTNLLFKVGHLKSPSGSYTKKKWEDNAKKIKSYFPAKKKLNILEIGCGTGALLYCFSKLGNIYGVDPSVKMLGIARKNLPKGKFYLLKAHQINFKKSFFDIVLMYSCIQFFPNFRYFKNTITKINKILKNDGLIFLGDIADADQEKAIIKKKIELIGKENYKKQYKNTKLRHLYLKRDEVINCLSNYFIKIEIFNSMQRGSEKTGNRFDILGYKK